MIFGVKMISNCDCLLYMSTLPDKCIDLVVTDPPYKIDTHGGGIYTHDDKQYIQELRSMDNGFDIKVLDELCRILKKINVYFFCSQKQILPLLEYFVQQKKCNYNLLTWHKSNPIPACGNKYITDTEYILFFREKGVKIYGSVDTKHTYYITPLNQKDKRLYKHPTVKPLNIVRNLIINSSQENDVVFDPFMGSGTTGVACKELNRNFIGIELDEKYFKIAEERINNQINNT